MNEPLTISVVVPKRGINDEGKGKKYALHKLISEVDSDYVWLQDDDIEPPTLSPQGMLEVLKGYGYPDMLILPLAMTLVNGSMVERLQQAEYAAIQQLTIETAQKGRAVMCSGANLIVKRDRWLESYADLHLEQPSGDDMYLLESFKRRELKVAVYDSLDATARVHPCSNLSAFIRQRMRWAGKAGSYTDKDIRRCGAIVVAANLLQFVCPLVMFIKFPFERALIKKRDANISLWIALLLEVVYPVYMLLSVIGGVLRSRQASSSF